MIIEINSKDKLIKVLKKNIYDCVTICYICQECDDEQVLTEYEIDDNTISQFEENNELMIRDEECTNCGYVTLFLKWEYIQYIEID